MPARATGTSVPRQSSRQLDIRRGIRQALLYRGGLVLASILLRPISGDRADGLFGDGPADPGISLPVAFPRSIVAVSGDESK